VELASLHTGETPVLRIELDGQFVKTIQTPSDTSQFTTDISVNSTLEQILEHALTITKLVEPIQGEVALLGITVPPEGRSAALFCSYCHLATSLSSMPEPVHHVVQTRQV
jgi:hypothetical protein